MTSCSTARATDKLWHPIADPPIISSGVFTIPKRETRAPERKHGSLLFLRFNVDGSRETRRSPRFLVPVETEPSENGQKEAHKSGSRVSLRRKRE